MTLHLRSVFAAFVLLCSVSAFAHAQAFAPGLDAETATTITSASPNDVIDGVTEIVHTQWSSKTVMPMVKKYHAVASMDGYIYCFGGYRLDSTPQGYQLVADATSYKYEIATDTWTTIKDIPSSTWLRGRAHAINGKIYLLAGTEVVNNSTTLIPLVYEYDPVADTYTLKTSMPQVQFLGASGVIDDKIYVIGGQSASAYLNLVQVYDPATDSWSVATNLPYSARYIGSATVDNKILVVGGYNNATPFGTSYYTDMVYLGEMQGGTLSWKRVADYPIGSIIFTNGVGVGKKAYFTGGRPAAFGNAEATDWTFEFDTETETWSLMEKKITGIQNCQLGTDGSVVVAPAGEIGGNFPTQATEVFDPSVEPPIASSIDPDFIQITGTTKGMVTATALVTLFNDGAKELTWSIEANGDFPWLVFPVTNGALEAYDDVHIPVRVDPSQLSAGETIGSIKLITNDPAHQEYIIEVRGYLHDEDIITERNVLVEEFSGTWCGWCPYGVDSLKMLEQTYGERVVVITYHNGTNDPMVTSTGNDVMSYLGVGSYPSASFDRIHFTGESRIPISRGSWGAATRSILENMPATAEITIKDKEYDLETKKLSFTAEVKFLQAVRGDYRLMLVQTTNQRNFAQTEYYSNGSQTLARTLYPYMHDHVVTAVLPNERGFQLGDGGVIQPLTTFTEEISYTSVDSIPDLSDLVLFVYERGTEGTGQVLQAHGEPMLLNVVSNQEPPVVGTYSLEQNYPNPFNPSTNIRFTVPNRAQVTLVVTDLLGREVATLVDGVMEAGLHSVVFDASNLQSGSYFVTMRSGDFVQTQSMTLMK